MGTLRKTYGPDFAPGVRSDTRLDTLRKRAGGESLSKLLKKKKFRQYYSNPEMSLKEKISGRG